MPNSPLSALKTDDWHQMVDVNIKGVLNGVAAVLPTFIEQKSGHVITTSSAAGLKAYPGGAVYGGTKCFVRDFMEVLRMESAMEGTNIRTATIYPAAINTELLGAIRPQGHGRTDAESVRPVRDLAGSDCQRRGVRDRPARGLDHQRVHGGPGQPALVSGGGLGPIERDCGPQDRAADRGRRPLDRESSIITM